jgi:hypothetical protein
MGENKGSDMVFWAIKDGSGSGLEPIFALPNSDLEYLNPSPNSESNLVSSGQVEDFFHPAGT